MTTRSRRPLHRIVDLLWWVVIAAAYLVVLAPIAVLLLAAFDAGNVFRFPPQSFSWRWFEAAAASTEYRSALGVSAVLGLLATSASLAIGSLAAYGLVRGTLRWRRIIELVLLAPLLLPLIVWSIALLQIYAWLGLSGTFGGLVLAHATVALPFTVRIMLASFAGLDPTLEDAAASLGAPPARVLHRVILPLAMPGLIVSAAFSFLVSFNDVIVSSFVAGSRWITFPVRVYSQLRTQGVDPTTVAIGAAIIAAILVLGVVGEKTLHWSRQL